MATGLEARGSARQRVWQFAGVENPYAKAVTSATTLADSDPRCVSANTTSAAFSVLLPASPYDGMEFAVYDGAAAGSWHTNNLTINGNGKTIALAGAAAAATIVCSQRSGRVVLRYDSTAGIWIAGPASAASGATLNAPVIANGLTASGSASNDFSGSTGTFKTSTGINTLGGRLAATATAFNIPDPGNAGAIPVTTSGVCNLTSAGAETRTVAAPTFEGQMLTLVCNVAGAGNVVTFASAFNQAGNTVATFNDAGDTLNVIGARIASALRWRLINNDGCTLS